MKSLETLLVRELRRQLEGGKRPILPAGGDLLFSWFLDLHKARRQGFNGPDAIAYAEIAAYAELNRWPMEPRHVSVLRAMDEAYLAFAHSARSRGGSPAAAQTGLSADAFDAIFG